MSYLPAPYTGYYTRVNNTVISGSELLSYLDGKDVRALEFSAAVSPPLPVVLTSPLGTTAPGVYLTPGQWIQSTILSLPVIADASAATYICAGSDTIGMAQTYIQMFNFQSTNELRYVRFMKKDSNAGVVNFVAANGSSGNWVLVQNISALSATTATNYTLFTSGCVPTGVLTGGSSSAPGCERLVLLEALNLTAGSQQVRFSILTGSG